MSNFKSQSFCLWRGNEEELNNEELWSLKQQTDFILLDERGNEVCSLEQLNKINEVYLVSCDYTKALFKETIV